MINLRNFINNKIISARLLVVLGLIALVLFSVLPRRTDAGSSASLYLSPSSGTFFIGGTFDVSILVNTGGENINAVEVNLKFDPKKLQIASPTTGKSFIEVWVSQPTYSNTQGTMSFIGGVPSPGIGTSNGLVSTVTFRAISTGETSIVFTDTSKVLRNDPQGTDILSSLGRGVYNIVIPPPEGPRVFSSTHPDQNKWYKNNNPTFSWEKEEGITDFSYSFDQDPNGAPDNIAEEAPTSVSYSEVEDGIGYFHVKAKKGKVWGGISHYMVKIDTTPPAFFTPTAQPSTRTTERQPLICFITTDSLSGVDYYQLKYFDISTDREEEAVGFFTEASSPYKLPSLDIGTYLVVVRAYDLAGNWQEQTVKIQIFPKGISFTKNGIQYKYFILPWWLLILILIIIITLLVFFLWRRRQALILMKRIKKRLRRIGGRLSKYKRKIQR